MIVLYLVNRIEDLISKHDEITDLEKKKIDFETFYMNWLRKNQEKISESMAQAIGKIFSEIQKKINSTK